MFFSQNWFFYIADIAKVAQVVGGNDAADIINVIDTNDEDDFSLKTSPKIIKGPYNWLINWKYWKPIVTQKLWLWLLLTSSASSLGLLSPKLHMEHVQHLVNTYLNQFNCSNQC